MDIPLLMMKLEEKEMSLAELAYHAKVDLSTIYNVMAGRSKPSYFVLLRVYSILKLSPEDFVKIFFAKSDDLMIA